MSAAPRFAESYPKDAELERLVAAFEAGDYATVRAGAPALLADDRAAELRAAARDLLARTEPDPLARWLFALATLLLAGLSAYWVAHDGPDPRAPQPAPIIEIPK